MFGWFLEESSTTGDPVEEEFNDPINYYSNNLTVIRTKLDKLQNENFKLNKEINHTYLNILEIHKKIKELNEQMIVNNKKVDKKIIKLDDRIKVVEDKLANYVLVE